MVFSDTALNQPLLQYDMSRYVPVLQERETGFSAEENGNTHIPSIQKSGKIVD